MFEAMDNECIYNTHTHTHTCSLSHAHTHTVTFTFSPVCWSALHHGVESIRMDCGINGFVPSGPSNTEGRRSHRPSDIKHINRTLEKRPSVTHMERNRKQHVCGTHTFPFKKGSKAPASLWAAEPEVIVFGVTAADGRRFLHPPPQKKSTDMKHKRNHRMWRSEAQRTGRVPQYEASQ